MKKARIFRCGLFRYNTGGQGRANTALEQRQGVADDQTVLVNISCSVATQHAVTPAQTQTLQGAILEYVVQSDVTLPFFSLSTVLTLHIGALQVSNRSFKPRDADTSEIVGVLT